jgi:hypothetical protein
VEGGADVFARNLVGNHTALDKVMRSGPWTLLLWALDVECFGVAWPVYPEHYALDHKSWVRVYVSQNHKFRGAWESAAFAPTF